MARWAILCMSQHYIQGIVFHNFIDSGDDREDIEHNFGLLRSNLVPKLAWRRLAALIPALIQATEFEWVAGQTAKVSSVKEAFEAPVSPIYAVRFRSGPNRWCTAIWATSTKSTTARVDFPKDDVTLEVCKNQFNLEPHVFSSSGGRTGEPRSRIVPSLLEVATPTSIWTKTSCVISSPRAIERISALLTLSIAR